MTYATIDLKYPMTGLCFRKQKKILMKEYKKVYSINSSKSISVFEMQMITCSFGHLT
jgi:hypothetical protein